MWRAGRVPSWRVTARLCSNKPPTPSCSSSPQSNCSPRPHAEKQRRRRQREEAILSSQRSTAEDEAVTWREKQKIVYAAQTPPGTKKDTSLLLPSSYCPEYVESSWYQWWEKEGFFRPEQHRLSHRVDQTFALCIPPPNVTGTLHLGHALTVAVEDALVRRRRMQGYRVLWVPGCDHAGIATQTVVERRLLRDGGKRRQDFTRKQFLREVWKWKNETGEEIYHQLRRLGASLDWSRACFTMDPGFSRAVTEAFVRLSDSGLIYRSEALVNWSCALESAISDIEVDSQELSGQTMLSVPGYKDKVEFGTMLTFAYPLEGHDGEVAVSTTRPETMLGDVAVAVHPDDPRYQAVHGKHCRHPFTNRLLPIITDSVVDMELGTGAVKVTPAHDHTDFLLSQRHALPRSGNEPRNAPIMRLEKDYKHGCKQCRICKCLNEMHCNVLYVCGLSSLLSPCLSRSGDIIEPLLKKQWFVSCEEMAKKAIQVVEDGQLEIIPHHYTKTWKNWLSNISDWCISRQLWWGHQIPAYQVEFPNSTAKQEVGFCCSGRTDIYVNTHMHVFIGYTIILSVTDPDVLDTWFSSGLFPFAMLGWPEQTTDLQCFYPSSILETGSDLIFFWVARMVMLGTELTGQLPFKQVLLHSLVRDRHGRKMSKSLGNVIDPLDVIHGVSLERLQEKVKEGNLDPRERLVAMEAQRKDFPKGIPQCGTDALRFALCSHKMQGEDISLSISQVLSCRHFCNKMWQTLKFTLGLYCFWKRAKLTSALSSLDRWICSRLYSTVAECEQAFETYELHVVTSALYSFWVHSLCDVYMVRKHHVRARQVATSILYHCVSMSLALLSPFMPFITEELWQRLQPFGPGAAAQTPLCLQPYPCSSQLVRLQPSHLSFPPNVLLLLIVFTLFSAIFQKLIHYNTVHCLRFSRLM
uniref:Valine--tRNA ligase, mitochondrial n=1 Tax=Cyclopterus lumpus TaxID=8103 RepID=A0A8C2WWQ8_CYCLU